MVPVAEIIEEVEEALQDLKQSRRNLFGSSINSDGFQQSNSVKVSFENINYTVTKTSTKKQQKQGA